MSSERATRALEAFRQSNIPITSDSVLDELKSAYGGDSGQKVTLYRGLLFRSQSEAERFYNGVEVNSGYVSSMPSSFSTDTKIAHEFSRMPKTYDDMNLAREAMKYAKIGETVGGYEGALIEVEVDAGDCIDLRKADMGAEGEMLLMPGTVAKVINIEKQIPLSRQFNEGALNIDSCIRDFPQSSPEVNFILKNFIDKLDASNVGLLLNGAKAQSDERREKRRSGDAQYIAEAKRTGEVIAVRTQKRRFEDWAGERDHYYTYFNPNGVVICEWDQLNRIDGKYVQKTELHCPYTPSWLVEMFATEEGVNAESQALALSEMQAAYNAIAQAIIDASECAEFTARFYDHYLREAITKFADPMMLALAGDAVNPEKASQLLEVESAAPRMMNKEQLRSHTAQVESSMAELIQGIAESRPSQSNPKSSFKPR
ncbi:hypothetical protein [Vibrio alginolyticus]|uniref:hypothetical protein n=1 Tax=Vibrio alginolyticus TaxID=663 RepID=UPI0006CA7CA8|nr:hypothetical protein [Vibrio alginolyticus]KPM98381.1 hypothetical protein AOG25_08010 [Vibrio alginolyticus]